MADVETGEANVDRGEFALVLDGERYVLRPSYQAIVAFEGATGKGLLELAQAALAGQLTLGETAAVACECIRAWGRATDNVGAKGAGGERIAELILDSEGGLIAAMPAVGAVLAMAATGGLTAQGEVRATTKATLN